MLDSVHFARWLSLFANEPIDFFLFPSTPNRRVHPIILDLLEEAGNATFSTYSFNPKFLIPIYLIDKPLGNRFRALLLRLTIRQFSPQFLHAVEIQNAGYLASRTYGRLKNNRPIFIATNYGSDIYWFSRETKHSKLISKLLHQVDRYAAECLRDVELAKELGFRGETMPVLPNAGGFTRTQLDAELVRADKRKLILVKGYHGWVGRAHTALRALESISAELQDYEIAVYSCNLSTKRLARQIGKRTGLNVIAYSKGALSHDEMVEKFSRSIIYVGLSLSDGISTSMLEAMAMGAIPVQTDTACCDEWFSDTGVAIRNLTVEDVALGIQKAIGLALTTDAAVKNRETIRARASREEIAKQALAFYQL